MTDKLNIAKILLIDDNPSDVRLFREVLHECGLDTSVSLTTINNSDKALAHLTELSSLPDLILLDINLPRKNGIDLLSDIKQNATLRTIPVIVMTTSEHERDIKLAYENHANSYIMKPTGIAAFADVIQGLYQYWFKIVHLNS